MRLASLAALLLLAACQREAAPAPGPRETGIQTSSGLERAAIETGAIADAAKVPAIGLYQRNHEAGRDALRSEEHTSELQSLMRISYAVFCLKKKNNRRHKMKNTRARTENKEHK